MANKDDYKDWSREELIREVKSLEKKKTYGLVWETDNTKEVFDYYLNWEGSQTKETFGEEEGKFPVLKEIISKSLDNEDSKYNLMIEGDNYHSLAVLNFTHEEAIDVIYIDPPYNTGNKDFIYNDKMVDREDGFRHSKWLSFMSKRLWLAKNLLKDTGVIFISIDNNEFAQLKILCDQIFLEKNFICDFIWKKRSGGGYTNTLINYNHEYILAYAKDISKARFNDKIKDDSELSNIYKLKDKRGLYKRRDLRKSGSADLRTDRPTMYYPVIAPDKTKVYPLRPDGRDGRWSYAENSFKELLKKGEVEFVKNGAEWKVYTKERPYTEEGEIKKQKYESILQDIAINTQGTNELKNIFPENDTIFNNPKPINLVKHLLNLSNNKNGIVLDFFAGSGTTGHAVMDLNKTDGGKRKFILCTNNESNNGTGIKIASDVCYPRIKKVIEGYTNKSEKIEGFKDNLKYFKTDFVNSTPTDANKKKIVDKSTEMLCIKENAFKLIKDKQGYKIFKNSNIHLGIIFDEDEIKAFVKDAKEIDGKFHVYVFSFDDTVPKEEFESLKGKVELCPIPEVILHVYRRILK